MICMRVFDVAGQHVYSSLPQPDKQTLFAKLNMNEILSIGPALTWDFQILLEPKKPDLIYATDLILRTNYHDVTIPAF